MPARKPLRYRFDALKTIERLVEDPFEVHRHLESKGPLRWSQDKEEGVRCIRPIATIAWSMAINPCPPSPSQKSGSDWISSRAVYTGARFTRASRWIRSGSESKTTTRGPDRTRWGRGAGKVRVGVGVILARNPLSKRYSAIEVGEVGVKRQPHMVDAHRHAEKG
jgi:hypothetical protein